MSKEKLAIADFFLSPRSPKRLPKRLKESGKRSFLHVLRRDLCKLYGPERFMGESERPRHKAPLLSALGILVGIDMMANFSCPSALRNNPGGRFKWFVREFSNQAEDWQVDFLWDLRNAIAHEYTMKVRKDGGYRFSTEPFPVDWVVKKGHGYTINLWGLKDLFREMIRNFRLMTDFCEG